jgi:hypothetical protein
MIGNKYIVKVIPGDHRPPHVHVIGGGGEAKFTLDPVECYYSRGYSAKQRERFRKDIVENLQDCLEVWNESNEN